LVLIEPVVLVLETLVSKALKRPGIAVTSHATG
jgi:hypothetical protein